MDPSFAYAAGPGAQGLSWYVTFPAAAGDASSLVVSTENGPQSVVASAGMLSGTDPLVRVAETVKGGLRTSMVRRNSWNVFLLYYGACLCHVGWSFDFPTHITDVVPIECLQRREQYALFSTAVSRKIDDHAWDGTGYSWQINSSSRHTIAAAPWYKCSNSAFSEQDLQSSARNDTFQDSSGTHLLNSSETLCMRSAAVNLILLLTLR